MPTIDKRRLWNCTQFLQRACIKSVILPAKDTSKQQSQELFLDPSAPECKTSIISQVHDEMMCTLCQVLVDKEHYLTRWHLTNLKLNFIGASCLTWDEFNSLSISDANEDLKGESDSESSDSDFWDTQHYQGTRQYSDTTSNTLVSASPQISFLTQNNQVVTLWKNVLVSGKHNTTYECIQAAYHLAEQAVLSSTNTMIEDEQFIRHPFQWTIMMVQSGYFAGAVFKYDSLKCHKRIARYTTRRKQGTSQMAADASKGGSFHSAGANLRRYNHIRLQEEIIETLVSWKSFIERSSLIFIFAPGLNRNMLFPQGGPLDKEDDRIRKIHMPVERPRISELKRIHMVLSMVQIQGYESYNNSINSDGDVNMEKMPKFKGEIMDIVQPKDVIDDERDMIVEAIERNDIMKVKELFDEDYLPPAPKHDHIPYIYLATSVGNVEMVKCLLDYGEDVNERCLKDGFNLRTALHYACDKGLYELVTVLLEARADPTVKDVRGILPYDMCRDEYVKRLFNSFAGVNPGLWDYEKAHIGGLDGIDSKEKVENKKRQKKVVVVAKSSQYSCRSGNDKYRETQSAAQNRVKEEIKCKRAKEKVDDETEVKRAREEKMALLTEREKRAHALDLRLTGGNICDYCKENFTITPFERLGFKYCSSLCVVEHKRKL